LPKYNTYNHHFHKENTEASQCINCHMTGNNYMGIDFRRDHSFRVPRPDQSVKYGTPNACNGCHKDQSSKWAAEVVVKNYGVKRPAHFSDELLVGYFEKPEILLHFVANLNHPDIVRASALNYWSDNHLNEREIKEVLKFFTDKSPLVRNQAVLTIGKFKNADYSNEVKPLLQDSIRLVRLSAFRYFVMNNKDLSEMSSVQKEYEIYLRVNADFASGQHQLALIRQVKGDIAGALQSYKKALKIDDHYNMSRMNMALLYYQNGQIKEAENTYLKVIQQEPDYATAYYMLGLLYNETGDLKSSLRYLEISTQKDPNNIRAIYNYSLKLQEIGEYRKSLKMIENALKKSSNHEDLLYLKLLALLELKENSQALQVCENLIRLQPQNENYNNLYKQLKGNPF
jgi:tetratricopeptide (TPR) repeat protein